MKRMFKPYSILFYFFVVIVFFIAGVYFAGITGAAEGQGLAGAAIVLGYGVITAFVALILSLILVYYVEREIIVKANKVLGVIFLIFAAITAYRIITMERVESGSGPGSPTSPKQPASSAITAPVDVPQQLADAEFGLGFYKPDFFNRSVLYFYGNPNFAKSVMQHSPSDSIVFQQMDGHRYNISYAPPWLVPEHLKMDYEILYFKVKSVNRDFVEIYVNKITNRHAYVDRQAGQIIYWPDFFLNVHSVEFPANEEQTVRVKPLNYAGQVSIDFEFMKPLRIQEEWMEVELQDDDFQKVGDGWIRWRNEDELLIKYSLLS